MTSSKDYLQPPELTPAPISILNPAVNNEGSLNIPLRPPPPLKAATQSQGLSILRKASESPNINRSITPVSSPSLSQGMEESKRTLWKCKRCNFRDASKDTVLQHVKSHYENSDPPVVDEKVKNIKFSIIINYESCFSLNP